MDCLDRKELEQFLKGKLDPERLLAVDEHVSGCAECKAALRNLPSVQMAGLDLGASLLGVEDCPEYEELSAYVDKALGIEQAKTIEMHANTCELCARDIVQIQELRSHAAMRPKVEVRQGMSVRPARSPFIIWKRVLAGVTVAAAVGAVTFTLSHQPSDNNIVAKNPETAPITAPTQTAKQPEISTRPEKTVPDTNKTPDTPGNTNTAAPAQKPDVIKPKPAPVSTPAPTYVALLKDGSYSVVKQNGKMGFAKSGAIVRDELEARLEAAIAQKMRTGQMKPAKSVQVAYAKFGELRGSNYTPPPTAPKELTPDGRIMLDATPVLKWSEVDLAVSYRVRVFKEGKLVAEEVTDNNNITLDTPLQRGCTYKWQVAAKFSSEGSWYESYAAAFSILSDSDMNSIEDVRSSLPGSHLALGAAYEYFGLDDMAKEEYQLLKKSNPNSNLPQRLLHGLKEAGR